MNVNAWVGFEPGIFGSTGRRFTDWASRSSAFMNMRNDFLFLKNKLIFIYIPT